MCRSSTEQDARSAWPGLQASVDCREEGRLKQMPASLAIFQPFVMQCFV